MRLIVLAAGAGRRLRPLTENQPKALVPFLGRPLLDWTVSGAKENGVTDIIVIGGWQGDRLARPDVQLINNPDYSVTSMVGSLMHADTWFSEEFVMTYCDIVWRPEVLRAVLASTAEIGVVVDLDWQPYWERRFRDPLSDALSLRMTPDGTIRSIGRAVERLEDVQAQYIGMVVFRGRGVKALRRAWIRAKTDATYRRPILGHRNALDQLTMMDLLDELATGDVPIKAIPIHGGWVDIDTPDDLVAAEERWTGAPAQPIAPEPASQADADPHAEAPSPTTPVPSSPMRETNIFRVPSGYRAPRRW
ncbi:MAG TPA: phosphocholine cytidylyltransferase family protein [Candidatus Limnocylindrales bacterium]